MSISVTSFTATPQRQRMYLPPGVTVGHEYWADVSITVKVTSSVGVNQYVIDWRDGNVDTVANTGNTFTRTHRYVFNHTGAYQCGLGHKVIKATAKNTANETASATYEVWNLSDHIRPGIWSDAGANNEDTYEAFFNRGLTTQKSTHNYTAAAQAPSGEEKTAIAATQGTAYPARHRVPERYLKTGNENGAAGEPGSGKVTSYNLTWYHIVNDLRCQPITDNTITDSPYAAWPPAGTYKNADGTSTTYSSANGNLNNCTVSVWFIDHFRRYKEWAEPFYYCFDGEPERGLDIHNHYWNNNNRTGADRNLNVTETAATWRAAFDQVATWMDSIQSTSDYAGTGVPNCVGRVIDLTFNTPEDGANGGAPAWYAVTKPWGYLSASTYNRFGDGSNTTWRHSSYMMGIALAQARLYNKVLYWDEFCSRADDKVANITNATKVSGTTWQLTAAGTGVLGVQGGTSNVDRAQIGQDVLLAGFSTGYNGYYTVISNTATTFTIDWNKTAAPGNLGNVQYTGRRPRWWSDARKVMKGQIQTDNGLTMSVLESDGFNPNSGHPSDGPYVWLASESGGDQPTQDAFQALLNDPAFSAGWQVTPPDPPPDPPPTGGPLYNDASTPYNSAGVTYGGAAVTDISFTADTAVAVAGPTTDPFFTIGGTTIVFTAIVGDAFATGVTADFAKGQFTMTALVGTATAVGVTASFLIATPPPPSQLIPSLAIKIIGGDGVATRYLNDGVGSTAAEVIHSSIMNGGYSEFSCYISLDEFNASPDFYKYGRMVEVTPSSTIHSGGNSIWEGFLKSPLPTTDGKVQLIATGWKQILEEREEDLMWQDRYIQSWMDTGNDDLWGSGFKNDDSISATPGKTELRWKAQKGAAMKNQDTARLGWFYDHDIRRIAGRIKQNIANPGNNYNFALARYDGPAQFSTRGVIYNFSTELDGAAQNDFDMAVANRDTIAFELIWNSANADLNNTYEVNITQIRINGDAYRGTPPDWDNYQASEVMKDLCSIVGFATGQIDDTNRNILPLWWTQGSMAELADYLALGGAQTGLYKWAVWGRNANGNPILDFSSWASSKMWTVYGYTGAATTICDLSPSDDIYNRVAVRFKQSGSPRTRTVYSDVKINGVNPFASLPGIGSLRKRTFPITLPDPCGRAFAQAIGDAAAFDLGQEQFSGVVTLSAAFNGTNTQAAHNIRAGDSLRIPDFPYGDRQFRIFEAQHFEDHSELTIGDKPMRLERLEWAREKKRMRKGRVSSTPQ